MASDLSTLVKNIQQHVETIKTEGEKGSSKMSLAKKKETLYNIHLHMKKYKDRKVVSEKQKVIEPLLFSLCEIGCGVSLINEIMTLLEYFYRFGDSSSIPSMLEKLRTIFETSKSLYSKICSCRLTGKIFEEFWKKTITPPTLEIVQSLQKMYKNCTEWYTKETAIETLSCILKTQCQNLDTATSEIYKLIMKGISDKVKDLRLSSTRALLNFVQAVDLLQELKGNDFQNIITTCLKGFADPDEKIRCTNAELMKEIFCLKIKQNIQKQGYSPDAKMASSKKKLLESLPNDLLEVVQYLSNNIYNKAGSTNNERRCVVECIFFIIHEVPLIFSVTDKQKLIEEVLNLKPTDKSGKNPPQRSEIIISNRLVSWLISQIIKEVEQEDQIAILKIFVHILSKHELGESELSILLNGFNTICHNIDCSGAFVNDQELTDLLMPYIKSGKVGLQISACEIIKTVSHHTPEWIHPLISTLVSHTSITHAELAGLPFTPVYVLKILPNVSENYSKDSLKKAVGWLNQVNALAHALALVFSSINHSLKGVPITISNSSFNAAKAMILGNFQTEDDEEDIQQIGLADFDISDSPRREAGWILFEGLLHLGNQWVGSKVNTIYKIWNSVFSKDMCEIDVERIKNKDVLYLEKILTEFKIKKMALSTIKWFLNKWFVLLNSQLIKLIAGFLTNAVTFFISQDKKEIIKLFKTTFNEDYLKVRSDLYECLSNLHPSLYSGKFVHILHSVAEDIVNEALSKTMPNIAYKTLCKEDEQRVNPYLHKECVPTALMNDDLYFDSSSSISSELLDLTCRHSPWLLVENDRMSADMSEVDVRMTIRNNAVQVFADIFISSHLNVKNKIHLSNHFLQHVKGIEETMQPNKKNKKKNKDGMSKERKIAKLVTITSAVYMVALGLLKKDTKDIDQQVFGNLESVLRLSLSVEHQFLNRICSEGLVMLYKQTTSPDYITSIVEMTMKKLDEEQAAGAKTTTNIQRHVLVLGNILRYIELDEHPQLFESVLSVFTHLSKTTNSVLRQYVIHYLSMSDQEEFYRNTYPICFHQMQTDILPEQSISNSMCRFTERILRHFQIITDIQSKCIVVFKEFINHGLTQAFTMGCVNYLVESYLRFTKTVMILQDKVKKEGSYEDGSLPLSDDEMFKIAKIVIKIIETSSDLKIKQVCVEIIAVILNQGDIEMLEQLKKGDNLDEDFYCFLFNEINSTKTMIAPFNSSKMRKKISSSASFEHITHHAEFERIINFNHNALDSFMGNMTEYDQYCREYYEYSLEIVFLYALKISANYKLEMWVKFSRYFISYKHMSLAVYIEKEEARKQQEAEEEEEKKKGMEEIRNTGPLEFRLSTDLKESTKMFLIQCLTAFVTNYATTDGHSKLDISKHISKLINIAFSAANSEDGELKKVGLSLIIELVKKFQYTEEAVDKEDEETIAQLAEEKGLLIEQYEAQISSIIRQNIIREASPEIQIKAFDLLYYFITVPISRDPEIISRILSQIIADLQTLSLQGEEQGYYDRIISEAHFEKLELLCKLFLISKGEEITKFYSIDINPKTMNEEKDMQNIINSKCQLKLKKEDKKQITEIFKELGIEKILRKQLSAAIYDAYIVVAMPRSVVRGHRRFVFLTCGMRSAYNLTTIERTCQYFMKCLVYFVGSNQSFKEIIWGDGKEDAVIKDIFENYGECKDFEILLALIQFYLVNEIEQEDDKGDNNKNTSLSHALYNHIKLRLFCLELLTKLFKNISMDYECLKELLGILDKLSFIAVIEINAAIVKLCTTMLTRIENSKDSESNVRSIILKPNDSDVEQTKLIEKECHIITIVEKLALKILDQLQSYIYQDINLGELQKKVNDRGFDGLEAKFMDNDADNKAIGSSKLALLKDTFDLLKQSLNTSLTMKNYCKDKVHLNKNSEEITNLLQNSFEVTVHRFSWKLPLSIKAFAKFYYSSLTALVDSIWESDISYLNEQVNRFIIRVLSTIKVCNAVKVDESQDKTLARESSEDDSGSNSERIDTNTDDKVDTKKADTLKASVMYMTQLLNKIVVNAVHDIALEDIKDSFAFYIAFLFDSNQTSLNEDELVSFKHLAFRSLNSLFTSVGSDSQFSNKLRRFSDLCFEESLVFLFSQVQELFAKPSLGEDMNVSGTIGEVIKFIANKYLCSSSEQKEVIIDPIVKLLLGILVGLHERQIQRTKSILTIINATGDALYSIILIGDSNLAKNYIASNLNDAQKQMLQNVIKAIASTKKAQEDKEQKLKTQVLRGNQKQGQNQKSKENQSKIKLATKIGK